MEFVSKDKGGDWHFDGDKTYWCLDAEGKPIGKIYAEYIPDPVRMWKNKAKRLDVSTNSQIGKQLKPNPVLWDMHDHARKIAEKKRKEAIERRNANANN